MTSQLQFQELWNLKYNELFRELSVFVKEWEKTKKCKCKNPECNHYQKEKWKRYGTRIDELFDSSLKMNAVSFICAFKEN
ncbi:MAG: hypothetical protein KKD18_03425 [Nanoarchaeota archaeon]|nr:hypothetical protein [Nanoarchaeota archaeon]MBU0977441.1 hypothetical protein [Nanoarchaeota archaeon]